MGGCLHAESEFKVSKLQFLHPEPKHWKKLNVNFFENIIFTIMPDSRHSKRSIYRFWREESDFQVRDKQFQRLEVKTYETT